MTAGVASGSALGLHVGTTAAAKQDATPEASPPTDLATQQVLRVATGSTGASSFTFTPLQGGGDQQNWQTLMWMPPMYFDTNRELKPGIFDSWESNEDYTVWTFQIDPRAKWSDNTPVTAADVKGTWELMADPLTQHGRITGYLGSVEGLDALRNEGAEEMTGLVVIDDRTLEVRHTRPDPVFHWRISTTHMNPVKIEQARSAAETFWLPENSPAVSGPYMLAAYDPDRAEAQMVPNPNWWRDEGPYLTEINFRFVPDQQIVSALVENNEVDVSLAQLPLTLTDQYPDFFRKHEAIGFNTFWMNVNAEPTSELNVRKALTHAVNFEEVFLAAYPEGKGAVRATQIVDTDLPCHETEQEWYAYDPAAAQAALAESSYGSADALPRIRVTPRGNYPPLQRALEAIIEFWRQNLGITNVEFRPTPEEYGPDTSRINVSRDDVVIRFPDTATYMWTAAHSEGPIARVPETEGGGMLNGYKNPQVDALIDEALLTPVEDQARCDQSLEAQRLFMNDYPLLLLADEGLYLNARDYVRNYEKGPDTTLIESWRIYIAEH
jgi:peptide/nickel transport system substrate-binding protein